MVSIIVNIVLELIKISFKYGIDWFNLFRFGEIKQISFYITLHRSQHRTLYIILCYAELHAIIEALCNKAIS